MTAFDRFQFATCLIAEGNREAAAHELSKALRWIDRHGDTDGMRDDLASLRRNVLANADITQPLSS